MQLPKRIDQHITESKSYRIFANNLPNDWIMRDVTERDYGIDCYVEICEEKKVTGKLLSIQLKGSENITLREEDLFATYYGVEPATLNYWNNLPMPVIFLFIDVNSQVIYFCNIKLYIRENYELFQKEQLLNIKIPSSHILNKKYSAGILSMTYTCETTRIDFEYILSSFLFSVNANVELLTNHYYMDASCPIEGEDEIRFFTLYKECNYLKVKFDIKSEIPSLKECIENGQKVFGDYYLLYEYFTNPIVISLANIIIQILDKIKEMFTSKESDYWRDHNYLLWKYFSAYDYSESIKSLRQIKNNHLTTGLTC